ncbi:MAG TPA: C1 family peptidase [Elusimicrobiales bacterium]|nr:C1 family peptidase [Elusimicrobiales bacterium]HPO95565.1 C1 family peptidase [Elusimicrobiales bacterium]
MKNKIKRVFLSFFLFFLFSKASAQNNPEIGPLNPAFLNYLNLKQTGMIYHQTETGKTLGKTPSTIPVIFSTKTFTTFKQTQSAPPASYDLRNLNKITPVKNQGACGDCWAYAAMSSLESYFMPNESLDLSEEHLNAYNGFDFGSCNGGNDQMSAAYFTRWSGPVTETSSDVIKHVQNIIFLRYISPP